MAAYECVLTELCFHVACAICQAGRDTLAHFWMRSEIQAKQSSGEILGTIRQDETDKWVIVIRWLSEQPHSVTPQANHHLASFITCLYVRLYGLSAVWFTHPSLPIPRSSDNLTVGMGSCPTRHCCTHAATAGPSMDSPQVLSHKEIRLHVCQQKVLSFAFPLFYLCPHISGQS